MRSGSHPRAQNAARIGTSQVALLLDDGPVYHGEAKTAGRTAQPRTSIGPVVHELYVLRPDEVIEREDRQISARARCDSAPVRDPEDVSLSSRQLVHRLFQRQVFALSYVTS